MGSEVWKLSSFLNDIVEYIAICLVVESSNSTQHRNTSPIPIIDISDIEDDEKLLDLESLYNSDDVQE